MCTHELRYLCTSEETTGSLGLGAAGCTRQVMSLIKKMGCWKQNWGPLLEKHVLLIGKPPLQPQQIKKKKRCGLRRAQRQPKRQMTLVVT